MNREKLSKFLTVWLLCFAVLFILSFPLQYTYLKFNILVPLFEGAIKAVAPSFIDNPGEYTFDYLSDSTGLYLNLVLISLIALALTFLWMGVERLSKTNWPKEKTWAVLNTILVYYLSLQMLLYGFNKLFKFQFYDAHPNTLYTPVGYLTKDFLFWTSMGTSSLYNIATGGMEVLVGLLLLLARTRNLGIILGVLVSAYLVLINFSFDINVKVQSLSLLLFFLVLLYPNVRAYYSFFNQLPTPRVPLSAWVKVVVIGLILGEVLYPYVSSGNYNGDNALKPPHYGAYAIENDSVYKRFFIHSDPYFIIQDMDDHLYSFPMEMTPEYLLLKGPNEEMAKLSYYKQNSAFIISGDFFGHPMEIRATQLDISGLPLNEDTYRWSIDGYQ